MAHFSLFAQQPETDSDTNSYYAKGNFIVKFKSTGPNCLNQCAATLLKEKSSFKNALTSKSSSIDKLIKKYKVKSGESLFFNRGHLSTEQVKEQWAERRKNWKIKYPNRSKRAPKDVKAPDLVNIFVFNVSEDCDIEEVCYEFKKNPHVDYATPNYLFRLNSSEPNDEYYNDGRLWGLDKIEAPEAWDISKKGEGVVVAIVDSGVDIHHPDLKDNIWINEGEIPNNRVDDDGNGYVDDYNGWNFDEENNDLSDTYGHGTHLAGTIAAVGNNKVGVIGVAPQAKIMPVKGVNGLSGWTTIWNLMEGMNYAVENGADVINNSWASRARTAYYQGYFTNVIENARAAGVIVVFSAGDENDDVSFYNPQNSKDVITVAAFDKDDKKADFSMFGLSLDVAAPGVDILSLSAHGGNNSLARYHLNTPVGSNYVFISGTSMAAAHVSGPCSTHPIDLSRLYGRGSGLCYQSFGR